MPTGTVSLTAARQSGRAPVTGAIAGASAIEYEAELCGESTTPCL